MELAVWTYEGPPHVGAMRVAASMQGVHYVLHAPQGDTYADLLFTMIERNDRRPPVTYSTFQARDLGGDTAELVRGVIQDAYERFQPDLLLVGESCTAELIQDQPGPMAARMDLPVPVVPLELPAYSKKENWGASETFYAIVRTLLNGESGRRSRPENLSHARPRANLLGPTSLGFRCRDDVVEVTRLLHDMGVEVNVVAPLGATPADIQSIPDADFNICLYPEVAATACRWLEKNLDQPCVTSVPIGVNATAKFVEEVAAIAGVDVPASMRVQQSRLPWYSRSVDSTYLTGKSVFIFGDATHAIAAAYVARDELGFTVVGLGTYAREFAREIRATAKEFGVEPLIASDYLAVEEAITAVNPELVLGTQMERHVAKRLGIPCAVISAPVHVQDFPARFSPQMGIEGANVLFDTWVHPLMMGLEEHLLGMFREDDEFGDALPSHLGGGALPNAGVETAVTAVAQAGQLAHAEAAEAELNWAPDAEAELKKIPFFVRGRARRNTERFAVESGIGEITLETLYEAKAHFGRS